MAAMRKTGRSLRWWLMSQLRDFAAIRSSYFADAASLRACGMSVGALQLTSPMRSFNLGKPRQIQTALSPRGVRTIKARTKPPFIVRSQPLDHFG
ncbi:hypothetical protein C1J05_14190 [Sulfitobacter sp. JL08]|nr:hypothetical protein C1J05_14190 [Sulfitobacter sp. JL08]